MAQITSSVGLISGLNTADIINQLMSIEAQPVTLLQTQINNVSQQRSAFSDLATQIGTLKDAGTALKTASTFEAATATSSNQDVLTATAGANAAIGTYSFQVARLVTTQQSVSQGFADTDTSTLSPGTITIGVGGGQISADNVLDDLNGGSGVTRGTFKITDKSGNTATIDDSSAVTLNDVVTAINTASGINVKATVVNNHLVITDQTGGSSTLSVTDVNDDNAATSLGIAGSDASGTSGTITGTSINYLSAATSLAKVNDGDGIRLGGGTTGDLSLDPGDGGAAITVSLSSAKTIGDVVKAINTAAGSRLTASVGANGLVLTASGGGTISASDLNGSKAAEDLGLTGVSGSGGTLNGAAIIAGLGTTLLSRLNGGSGIPLGTISIQNGAGTSTNVDLTGSNTVQDILDKINQSSAGVKASLNSAGNGIQITDTSGVSGSLTIGDVGGGTTATALGIATTSTTGTVSGSNLDHQFISGNTLLSNYNGGAGVAQGQFRITDSKGDAATISVSTATTTVQQLLNEINTSGVHVQASINSTGNGISITDEAGGTGSLALTESDGGTTLSDLNLTSLASTTGTGGTIDGALQKTIAVTSSDTLTTIENKINTLGFGVTASILNDGSSSDPYRLSLTATHSGTAGQVSIDTGTTGLDVSTLIKAQDAAVFYGDGSASGSLLLTSDTNTLTNVVQGVTVTLNGVSTQPVTLSVTRDTSGITTQLNNFVTNFNTLVDNINTLTQFNTTTDQGGLLLGDATVQQVQTSLYNAVNTVVSGAGEFKTLADLGITIGDGAKLSFDESTFDAAYAKDPTAVQNFFTQATTGVGSVIETDYNNLVDAQTGLIPNEENTLDTQTTQYQTRMTELNTLLDSKRSRLELQFANLETVLSNLQSQQSSLSSISGTSTSSSSSG